MQTHRKLRKIDPQLKILMISFFSPSLVPQIRFWKIYLEIIRQLGTHITMTTETRIIRNTCGSLWFKIPCHKIGKSDDDLFQNQFAEILVRFVVYGPIAIL
jgi:hypothetical protein